MNDHFLVFDLITKHKVLGNKLNNNKLFSYVHLCTIKHLLKYNVTNFNNSL